MKVRKVPLRTCVVSKEQYDKRELTRIVKNQEGDVFVDPTGKANGRGAYLKLSEANIALAKKTKALDKKLETTIPDQVYETLLDMVKSRG